MTRKLSYATFVLDQSTNYQNALCVIVFVDLEPPSNADETLIIKKIRKNIEKFETQLFLY